MTWVPIAQRTPTPEECLNNHRWFLVCRNQHSRPDISRYDGHDDPMYTHGWKYVGDDVITHWMELPEMP